jgi:hypothetical protein
VGRNFFRIGFAWVIIVIMVKSVEKLTKIWMKIEAEVGEAMKGEF